MYKLRNNSKYSDITGILILLKKSYCLLYIKSYTLFIKHIFFYCFYLVTKKKVKT